MKKLLLLFPFLLLAHPLNITKIWIDFDAKQAHLRFVTFNIHTKDPQKINSYILKHFTISNCTLQPQRIAIHNEIVINAYFTLACKQEPTKKIFFDMFFDQDPTQQGVCNITEHNRTINAIFSPSHRMLSIHLTQESNNLFDFYKEGIIHILTGYDHLTFLFLLILPALLLYQKLSKALLEVVEIATLFTISHSITLFLSLLHIANPPQNLIEILIAVTILLTALNNISPIIPFRYEPLIAFLFGFIHGFGFANAMQEMQLHTLNLAKIVLSFNLGIETGQCIIIALLLPLLWHIPKKIYTKFFISASFIALLLALYWIIERTQGVLL